MNERDIIFVSEDVEDIPTNYFPASGSLRSFFRKHQINLVGDLRTLLPQTIEEILNNNKKPFPELKQFIIAIQEKDSVEVILTKEDFVPEINAPSFYEEIEDIEEEIQPIRNINEWKQTDLSDESATPKSKNLNLPELLNLINKFSDDLPQMEKDIFFGRFGGAPEEQILTFQAIGERQQITTENTYQKYLKVINWLKKKLENSAEDVLKKIYDDCFSAVCPLMPKFLVYLTNNKYELFQYPAAFYIRIFGALMPEIPILPEIENQVVTLKDEARKIETEIETFLESKHLPVSLSEMFNHLMTFKTNKETAEIDFFKAIQSARFHLIMTDKPNELFIELKNRTDD